MKTEFEKLEKVLHEVSEMQQKCVKDENGNYIDIDERKLTLNSEDLKKWYSLNMEANNILELIKYDLRTLFSNI